MSRFLFVVLLLHGIILIPVYGSAVCQAPSLQQDGVSLPADDPCRGAAVYALPGSVAHIGLNDNVPPAWSDQDFNDATLVARFAATAASGVVDIYAQYTGGLTAHDVWAEINGTLLNKSGQWQFVGSALVGFQVDVWVLDRTEAERVSYLDPAVGWSKQTVENPEPAAWSLMAIGVMGLAWGRHSRGWLKKNRSKLPHNARVDVVPQ